jgi:adenylylsulfate kinase-like enzyme
MTFSRASEVEEVRRIAENASAHFLPVFLDCPVDVAQTRAVRDLAERHRAPEDRDESLVARVAERFEAAPADALRVDATKTPEEIAKAILDRLDRETAGA